MSHAEPLDLLQLSAADKAFLQSVCRLMESYFAADEPRIAHAHAVAGYARQLLSYIAADPLLTLTASYLHDIGIPEAERKYGRCDDKLQEQEGPPVAQQILFDVGAPESLIATVSELVANHHTPGGVDSPEFRILWDAEVLENLAELVADKEAYVVETILERELVTEAGYRLARQKYLPSAEA